MTIGEVWFNNSLRPRKPEGSLGRTAQDSHLNSHTAPELCHFDIDVCIYSACAFLLVKQILMLIMYSTVSL